MPRHEHHASGQSAFGAAFGGSVGCLLGVLFVLGGGVVLMIALCMGGCFGLGHLGEQGRKRAEEQRLKDEQKAAEEATAPTRRAAPTRPTAPSAQPED